MDESDNRDANHDFYHTCQYIVAKAHSSNIGVGLGSPSTNSNPASDVLLDQRGRVGSMARLVRCKRIPKHTTPLREARRTTHKPQPDSCDLVTVPSVTHERCAVPRRNPRPSGRKGCQSSRSGHRIVAISGTYRDTWRELAISAVSV